MTISSLIRTVRDTFDVLAAAFETDPISVGDNRLKALEREVRRIAATVDERATSAVAIAE